MADLESYISGNILFYLHVLYFGVERQFIIQLELLHCLDERLWHPHVSLLFISLCCTKRAMALNWMESSCLREYHQYGLKYWEYAV